jgi:molybdopterin-synthase adenylyltransferase
MADDRHSRQIAFEAIGEAGQRAIAAARITIVGCGALGSHSAEILVRAGVGRSRRGRLRIIDRDYVELSNLQRQTLFDEEDARRARPKALAAAGRLQAIDSAATIDPLVRDLNPANAVKLLSGADLVLDATDNFSTRFLINDACIRLDTPWIYAGAVGARGVIAFILPGTTPCLRCLMERLPPVGSVESCETAGVVAPLPPLVSGWQTAAALRWLVSREADGGLLQIDAWKGETRRLLRDRGPDPACLSCGTKELPALTGNPDELVPLCGRNSVQITGWTEVDLEGARARLERTGQRVEHHGESISAFLDEGLLTLFRDGRIIVQGTTDPSEARTTIARYLGS